MYAFLDYHRTIIAYHGTTAYHADRLVAGHPFKPSDNSDDWLGQGVYFWRCPEAGLVVAEKFKKFERPAVVGAMIRLGNCFDLLDPGQRPVAQSVAHCYDEEVAPDERRDAGEREPAQEPGLRDFQPLLGLAGDARGR